MYLNILPIVEDFDLATLGGVDVEYFLNLFFKTKLVELLTNDLVVASLPPPLINDLVNIME